MFMPVQGNVIFGVELVQTTDLRGRAGKVLEEMGVENSSYV